MNKIKCKCGTSFDIPRDTTVIRCKCRIVYREMANNSWWYDWSMKAEVEVVEDIMKRIEDKKFVFAIDNRNTNPKNLYLGCKDSDELFGLLSNDCVITPTNPHYCRHEGMDIFIVNRDNHLEVS